MCLTSEYSKIKNPQKILNFCRKGSENSLELFLALFLWNCVFLMRQLRITNDLEVKKYIKILHQSRCSMRKLNFCCCPSQLLIFLPSSNCTPWQIQFPWNLIVSLNYLPSYRNYFRFHSNAQLSEWRTNEWEKVLI